MLAILHGALAVQPACDLSLPSSVVCEEYCTSRCAFYNGTSETGSPQNITLYRITPANVTGVINKNTGDAIGDINFFLERKNMTLECAADPNSWGCFLDGGEHAAQRCPSHLRGAVDTSMAQSRATAPLP